MATVNSEGSFETNEGKGGGMGGRFPEGQLEDPPLEELMRLGTGLTVVSVSVGRRGEGFW
jgi:hypothetical protein